MTSLTDSLLKYSLSRRNLLKLFGLGTLGGALGYSRFKKPKPSTYDKDTLVLPTTLDRSREVAVIGGGLAGLAAAYQLSQRGFQVTLLERSPQLGGKIASWPIEVNGEVLYMEHGFHGFFPQYYNLWSLVDELTIPQNFVSLSTYAVVYKNGYQPEVFRPSRSAFPWNIVDLAIWSPNRLQWGINLTSFSHWQVFKEITGFNPVKSYEHLDNLSVTEWVNQGFPKGLYDLYFLPFAKSSLNAPDILSAGELMQFFHFYFFGNPEGLAFQGTRQDMGRSLVDPIAAAIEANGGQILKESSITQIEWHDGQIASLRYQQGGTVGSAPFWVNHNPLLSTEQREYFGAGDTVYALSLDGQTALSLTCTHQGCTVQPQQNGMYLCPCHGATFDPVGTVKGGPAKRSLPTYQVLQRQGDRLQLVAMADSNTTAQEQVLKADYYVMAADVVGMRNLFSRCEGAVDACIQQKVVNLAVADPFAVARFWLDRDFTWEHSDFTSLSGYALTDSITLYHHIQDDYKAWAARTGGSVVELHAYCYKETQFPTQEDLLTTFEQELYEIVPELSDATIVHRQLVNQKNFSGFPPKSYVDRPATASGVPNLFFAGDWVKMPFPCGLMERAVSSGLLAANAICKEEGVQRRTLLTVNPEGLLSPLSSI